MGGAREIAQWIRALTILRKDVSLILSINGTSQQPQTLVPEGLMPLFQPPCTLYSHGAHRLAIHTVKKIKLKNIDMTDL